MFVYMHTFSKLIIGYCQFRIDKNQLVNAISSWWPWSRAVRQLRRTAPTMIHGRRRQHYKFGAQLYPGPAHRMLP